MIIDDDENAIQAVKNLISQFNYPATIVESANSIAEGIPKLNQHKPDLLFLDIEMKNETGFELLESWSNQKTKIIFCTGYDQYGIEAIKTGAYDYLLKPLDYKEFSKLFSRLDKDKTLTNNKFKQESDLYKEDKIIVKSAGGVQLIEPHSINYLKADGRYTEINYADNKSCLSSKNLGTFDEILEQPNFQKINKSLIINNNKLRGVEKRGECSLILFQASQLETSDTIRKKVIKLLENQPL